MGERMKNLKVAGKLNLLAGVLIFSLLSIGGLSYWSLTKASAAARSMYEDRLVPIEVLGKIVDRVWNIREQLLLHVITQNPATMNDHEDEIHALDQAITDLINQYEATDLVQEEIQGLKAFREAWANYQEARSQVLETSASLQKEQAELMAHSGQGNQAFGDAIMSLEALVVVNEKLADRLNREVSRTATTTKLATIILAGVALLLAIFLSLWITRLIAGALGALAKQLANAITDDGADLAARLSVGSRDEIGEIATTINRFLGTLHEMMNQVKGASEDLAASSGQLAASANQATSASSQIAEAIQQVAAGANDQSSNAANTAQAMTQLREAIDQIAAGAQRQADEVRRASSVLDEAARAIDQVSSAVEEVSASAQQALASAQSGGEAVQETLDSMHRISGATGQVAERVRQLGQNSQQIGEIVQIISGIADQTNLLALNAAIEAARAGEHGKGFAVVAEEVRKLAERSGKATQEITALIGSIQNGVEAAVQAMDANAAEVEKGASLAGDTGQALKEILAAMEQTNRKVADIVAAARMVAADGAEAVNAMVSVSTVTEENTAATEEMTAASEEVAQSIEQIAAVSEETAAASEEVSSSSEEVNASMQEISSSAGTLQQMAGKLQGLVNRFRL